MAQTILIQVALVLICWAGVARSDAKAQLRDFLNENCKSDDPIGCIEITREEFNRLGEEWIGVNPYEEALKQILKLRDIIDNPSCTSSEIFYSLSFVEYSSIGHRRVPNPETLSPFDSLMHYASLKRAEKCRDIYVLRFSALYSLIQAENLEIVEGFKHRELVEDKAGMNRREYMEWLIDYEFNDQGRRNLVEAINYVRRLSSTNPNRNSPTLMFNEYLRLPCFDYNAVLYNQLVNQMRFDAEMFEGKTFYHLDEDEADTLIPLYQAMARTQFCKVFDQQRNFKTRFVNEWIGGQSRAAPAA